MRLTVHSRWRRDTREDGSMFSPEPAPQTIGRLFRADGDHITDLRIPAGNRPVDVVLWHSRVFQYKGTEASGQPIYFEASAYAVPEAA
jgi:hypothetical protein